MEGLEKERDFYFGKLRDIEVQCQEEDNTSLPVVEKIMGILYATEVRKETTGTSCADAVRTYASTSLTVPFWMSVRSTAHRVSMRVFSGFFFLFILFI